MSKISKGSRELRSVGNHENFLRRIRKTLYYTILPSTDRLSLPVTEYASEFFSEPRTGRSLDRLHCKDAAHISRQACISPCSFVLAMLYLERLKACNPEYLQCVGPSELFLVSLMISSKFLHDCGEEDDVFMDEWAASGGISVKELIDLEREFLNAIQWDVFVNESTFWSKLKELECTIAKKQGALRGHFTYTELSNLLVTLDTINLVNLLASVVAILVATYTAGLVTIVSSVFIASQIPGNCLRLPAPTDGNQTAAIDLELPQSYRNVDASDVLKAGIILASIKSAGYETNHSENAENISWDWWSSSALNWLAQTSGMMESFDLIPTFTGYSYDRFVDATIANMKVLDLEDQLHEGTKIRTQDRLEHSWHEEWTDTISTLFSYTSTALHFYKIEA